MIDLKIDKFKNGKVTFHISRQDKQDYERLEDKVITFEINGINYSITSASFPAFYPTRMFYARGRYKKSNYKRIRVEFSEYLIIYELVKKYNENFFQKVI